jgi:hypothetical protein
MIFFEDNTPKEPTKAAEGSNKSFEDVSSKNGHFNLPLIHMKNKQKLVGKKVATDRNSTDTSFGNEIESISILLPNIERKSIIRERNITMASRSSSRSISCRQKEVKAIMEVTEADERKTSPGKRMRKGASFDERISKKVEHKRDYSKGRYIKLRYADKTKPYF